MEPNLIERTKYYRIAKSEIKRLKEHLTHSSNSMEANYYSDRLIVQTEYFAKRMGVRESILLRYV